MAVQLNHTIVSAHDRQATAEFLVTILGFPPPTPFGPFLGIQAANDVTLDVMQVQGEIASQHYAFLVDESEFDGIFDRLREADVTYWADPHHTMPGRINNLDGGRGVYFNDPNGHNLEVITRPYGSGD